MNMHHIIDRSEIKKITKLLKADHIGILPTDTVYGLHCQSFKVDLVEKINLIKGNEENTPLISLISKIDDLKLLQHMIIGPVQTH